MIQKLKYTKTISLLIILLVVGMLACQPDKFGNGNGLSDPDVKASFTVTPIEGKLNTYLFKADEEDVLAFRWDKGDGSGLLAGKAIDTVFYPDADTYSIGLMAIGRGGTSAVKTQDLVVETSDPNAGNLVVGGKMDEGDDSHWNFITITDGVSWNLVNGKMIATGGGWGHAAIYQPIEVVAGKKYKVDMTVSGSGATDTWFEVYLGKAQPADNSDYSDGGIILSLNTWSGCGNTPFNGKLSSISCAGAGKGGVVQFDTSGTVYLLIKTGGGDIGADGISIDNVEFRGVN